MRKRDEVYVDFPDKADVMDWVVEDISVGGFRLRGTVDTEPGTVMDCVLSFPAAGVDVPAEARVVWSEDGTPRRTGLRFESLAPGDRLRLAHALYLKRQVKKVA